MEDTPLIVLELGLIITQMWPNVAKWPSGHQMWPSVGTAPISSLQRTLKNTVALPLKLPTSESESKFYLRNSKFFLEEL